MNVNLIYILYRKRSYICIEDEFSQKRLKKNFPTFILFEMKKLFSFNFSLIYEFLEDDQHF